MICRIDLNKTNYKQIPFTMLSAEHWQECEHIYKKYIDYHQLDNPHPVFEEEWSHKFKADVLGYYHEDKLVAWSLIYKFPSKQTVLADQFAWDYATPSLKLGHASIRNECAYYKSLGYRYFILGEDDKYKQELQGFEIIKKDSHGVFST